MKTEHLHELITEWFHEKGIIKQSGPLKQLEKTQEELTETRDAVVRHSISINPTINDIKDGIVDTGVTLIGICMMLDFDFLSILEKSRCDADFANQNSITILDSLQDALSASRDFVIMRNFDQAHAAIGAMIYDITNLCINFDLTFEDCLQTAYDVISKRTGRMIDGKFLKGGSHE